MNISYEWLTQYVKIHGDLNTLCNKLTTAGIEVEGVATHGTVPAGVVTAKILERAKHPDSDHMSVCRVSDGTNEFQVVCGAPNCDAGNVVPLATIGTVFSTPEGEFKIKKSKLRGVESQGMMCSGRELGISEDHEGLLLLDATLPLGKPVAELFPGDATIEVEVTPNRPDWLSHFGIARDVACLLKSRAVLPEISVAAPKVAENTDKLVTVEDAELCPCYTARIVRGVHVGPSPDWLQKRLKAIGLRSINNIVDITNFVLMELGQPLHAFDLDKLEGGRIVVRRARDGEKIVTLDGSALELTTRNLVICDAVKPMALAGVMGGENSGVTATTTDVLLESAVFNASNIRATARGLGISSDASYRYERGVDWDMCDVASDRAIALILELAGGTLTTARVKVATPRPAEPVIECRFERIRSLIGIGLDNAGIVDIFERLGLKVAAVTAEKCQVTAPLFRLDLTREADLAEEVARINGLEAIPAVTVKSSTVDTIRHDAYYRVQELREALLRLGLCECVHYTLVNDAAARLDPRFTAAELVRVVNPISADLSTLRPSLLSEMLGTVERNIARRNLDLRLFEIGKAFVEKPELFPEERQCVSIVLTGRAHPERFSAELEIDDDFYDLKGMVETLLTELRLADWEFVPVADARFAGEAGLALMLDGKAAGVIGELDRRFTANWRTTHRVFMAELEVAPILGAAVKPIYLVPVSNYPATTRDIAMVKPSALSHREVVNFIRNARMRNLEKVELFDHFRDAATLGAQRESLAYRLTFRAAERTLTDEEVNKAVARLRDQLTRELGVELR